LRAAGNLRPQLPAAQQDKTAGRTELPHRSLKGINLGFWSSFIRPEFDSYVSVLLFAHSWNVKSRGHRAKTERANFPASKSRIKIQKSNRRVGVPITAWGHAFGWWGKRSGPAALWTHDDRSWGKAPRRGWDPGRGFSRWDGGANRTTMIPRCNDG